MSNLETQVDSEVLLPADSCLSGRHSGWPPCLIRVLRAHWVNWHRILEDGKEALLEDSSVVPPSVEPLAIFIHHQWPGTRLPFEDRGQQMPTLMTCYMLLFESCSCCYSTYDEAVTVKATSTVSVAE